jgi:hypothetical protein
MHENAYRILMHVYFCNKSKLSKRLIRTKVREAGMYTVKSASQ